eukprot:g5127.t1
MTSKRLLNKIEDRVEEGLEGLSWTNLSIHLLDGFPATKVAYYANFDKTRVAVISGGGSGHEPAFAGFLGTGMLTAAICGDVFASPTAESILTAIRYVTGSPGCLLVYLNYTGDRLNFGLAAEGAKSEGLKVDSVVIGEDCGVRSGPRRGLAGSILVIKMLGHLAQRGMPLSQLVTIGGRMVANMGTIGVGLETAGLPGQPFIPRLEAHEVELGLGIHGEPGQRKLVGFKSDSIVDEMVHGIMTFVPRMFCNYDRVGLFINNLGGTPPMDLNAIAKRVVHELTQTYKMEVVFGAVGTFVTSITVSGFSISLLKMEEGYLEYLMSPTDAPAWTLKSFKSCQELVKTPIPSTSTRLSFNEKLSPSSERIKSCLLACLDALTNKEEELNSLDAKVGDGDCGTTLSVACQSIRADLDQHNYPFNQIHELLKCIGQSIGRASGGTSGALYNILFTAGAASMRLHDQDPTPLHWCLALEAGIEAVMKYGGASLGDRTMLDALIPVHEVMKESIENQWSLEESSKKIAEAVKRGADSTKEMVAHAGRSSYVSKEATKGVPDPGAKATQFWVTAIIEVLLKQKHST